MTFVTNGGSSVGNATLAFGDRLDLNDYVPTLAGKTFGGWYLSASDSEAYNATTMPDHNVTLYAKWITFALGSIKYDTDKKEISVNDEITADLFGAVCLDTDGNLASFTAAVNGTVDAGNTVSIRLVATSGGKTKQITITDVKVYGSPTLTVVTPDKGYINLSDGLGGAWFGANGVDTFGNAARIVVRLEEEYSAGDTVTVVIDAVDPAGNVVSRRIEGVKLYGKPEITYDTEKTTISVNDTINAALFAATAQDSFGASVTVTAARYSGTIAAGNTFTVRITATDAKGNVTHIDVAVKVYGAPKIGNAGKTEFKVEDEITVESLDLTATDTYGRALEISLSVKSGMQTAGQTMVYTAGVTDVAGNVVTKDISVKIYGTPTVTYDREGIKAGEDATAANGAKTVLNVAAKDSFGNALTVTATLKSESVISGTYVVYTLTATDRLGNVAEVDTAPIGVYDVNDIELTYFNMASDLIKRSRKGEEFSATATDAFGEDCEITVEAAEGFQLSGGSVVSIYLVATDKVGNRKKSDLIAGIKVYDIPTISYNGINYVIQEDADISFLFTVIDSFGEELYAEITADGALCAGSYVNITVKATDDAGNHAERTYRFAVTADTLVFGDFQLEKAADGSYHLTKYLGSDTEVVILDDLVSAIAQSAFQNKSTLTSVTIPSSVTSIGTSAFSYCSNLTSITFEGKKAKWSSISKGSSWNFDTGNYTVTCTDGTLTKSQS